MTLDSSAFIRPSFSLRNRLGRLAWNLVAASLFRWSPRPCHAWRRLLLRGFGARLGSHCHIYPKATIWAPWNLSCDAYASVADHAEIYNPSPVTLGWHAILSQHSYLCGASHDYNNPAFPLISAPIRVEAHAWICARATVQMGVTVAEGAVLALGGVATRDLAPWTVYGGVPARRLGVRKPLPSETH